MKLVEQHNILYGQTPTDPIEMCKWIEAAGRTCYKSEKNITSDSCVDFVRHMIKNTHTAVLEHSNIVFCVKGARCEADLFIAGLGERMAFHQIEVVGEDVYINGNLRAWIDTLNGASCLYLYDIQTAFNWHFGFIFDEWAHKEEVDLCGVELMIIDTEIPIRLRKYTMRSITNRAMTHEMVRHRIDSAYCQESQRYVNYITGVEFIRPVWADDLLGINFILGNTVKKPETATWINTMETLEKVYTFLINSGLKPQQAREVLPNSCKTAIVTTRGYAAWSWFFHLRDSKAADPQMQALAGDAHKQFISKISEFSNTVGGIV